MKKSKRRKKKQKRISDRQQVVQTSISPYVDIVRIYPKGGRPYNADFFEIKPVKNREGVQYHVCLSTWDGIKSGTSFRGNSRAGFSEVQGTKFRCFAYKKSRKIA